VTRPYVNTVGVATISSLLALSLGAAAAYGLARFQYRPKIGLIALFMGCLGLAILLMALEVPWLLAIVVAIGVYILLAQTIGRRFTRALGNNDIGFWLISQRMLPPIVTIIPIYMIFQQLRMLDTWGALIITYISAHLPLAVWFLRDYFQTIPIELEESAFIDGATRYQVLWRIILPLAAPGLVATFLIILVFAWNEYTIALFLTNANAQTMPLLVAAQNATRGPQWWNISVLVVLMIGPIIAAAIVLERFIARGLLVGAVKS
jgi:multiple sugar transport system permease protein